MKTNNIIFLFITALFFSIIPNACQVSSCSVNKRGFIKSFEKFISEVRSKDLSMTSDKWETYDKKFNRFVDECYEVYEEDLTNEERKAFWIHSLEYYSIRYGRGLLNELSDEEVAEMQRIKQHLTEIGGELEAFFDQNRTEITEMFDNFARDMENWSQKLQEILEDE